MAVYGAIRQMQKTHYKNHRRALRRRPDFYVMVWSSILSVLNVVIGIIYPLCFTFRCIKNLSHLTCNIMFIEGFFKVIGSTDCLCF